MKLIINFCIAFLISFKYSPDVYGAIIKWDGGAGNGLWSTPANWVGDIAPLSTDDVLLDNSSLSDSYSITLPAGAVTINVVSITISPLTNNIISLILPQLNTANPGLTVSGATGITLNNNGILKNSSGATTGSSITITGVFKINNGGHYIHNTSRGNATIVSQLSTVAGTELGIFEFDVPVASYVLSLSGRTFGTMMLSSAGNGGTVSYSGSGASALNINGNIEIGSGVNFSTSMSANIIIKGNFLQSALSTFNLQSSTNNNLVQVRGKFTSYGTITETNTGMPVLELNGSSNQDIDATGLVINNSVDVRLNNITGATLISNFVVPFRLSILSGNLWLGNYNLTTSLINQITPATQTNNHIVTDGTGFLKITGLNIPVIFPVSSSATNYNPITISGGNGSDFTVRVENGINPSVAFPTFGINRTWHVQASAVTAGVTLKFQYASADANPGANQPQDMELLMSSGGNWNISSGNTNITPAGTDPAWTITTTAPLTINNSSTPFALGVDGGWTLPVNCFVTCNALRFEDHVKVKWNLPSCGLIENFEVQRSGDGINYVTVRIINNSSVPDYTYLDSVSSPRTIFYRIKVKNRNGWPLFSNIVTLQPEAIGGLKIVLYPQPVKDKAYLSIQSARKEKCDFVIIDSKGIILRRWISTLEKGTSGMEVETGLLNAGIYLLVVETEVERRVVKFFKQ